MVATGVILGKIAGTSRAERIGLNHELHGPLFLWLIVGIMVGGHVGFGLFYHPKEYLANPVLFLDLTGGLSSFGGFIACTIIIIWFLRKHKQPFWPHVDCIAYGFSIGWFFGRLGCTINHEHPGTATRFFLGRFCRPVEGWTIEWPQWMAYRPMDLRFSHCIERGYPPVTSYADTVSTNYPGVIGVHDMGFYEAIYAIVLFLTFKWLDRKPRFPGFFMMLLVVTYGPLRFMMDFLRPLEDNPRYIGLTPAQWGCLLFLTAGIWGMKKLYEDRKTHPGLTNT